MAEEKKNPGNGSAYSRETRAMFTSFQDSIQKLIDNEFKHIGKSITNIQTQIKSLSDGVEESKKLYRSVIFALFGTVIGALIIAFLTRI